jgi:hypothetical protein
MNHISKEFFTLGWIGALMILAEYLCHFVLEPASKSLINEYSLINLILCFPKGILIIITWLYKAKGVMYLLITGLISQYVFHADEIDIWFFSSIIIFSTMPFIILEMFKACGIDMYQMPGIALRKQWRSIILLTFVCAVFNAIFHAQIMANKGVMQDTMILILQEVFANITGVVTCLILISIGARIVLLFQPRNN